MIITKKHLPRRTFLRGALGAMVAMPFLDAMIPALVGAGRASGRSASARSTSRTASTRSCGIRTRPAATSSSSRSCSRSSRTAAIW